MKTRTFAKLAIVAAVLAGVIGFATPSARAHCDGLDGPVVKAAQKALATGSVDPVLIWVQKQDEAQIKTAFQKTLAVRKLNAAAQDLADMYFFETLVRVHRAGEGAPYTGLKPAGRDLGPAIPAADAALENGRIDPVVKLLSQELENGVRRRFREAAERKKFEPSDVAAGREFVKAYVEYIHYVEGLHQAAAGAEGHHEEAAAPAVPQPPPHRH